MPALSAHGAYTLHLKAWVATGFATRSRIPSNLRGAEKAALRLARDAALVPSAVGPEHIAP